MKTENEKFIDKIIFLDNALKTVDKEQFLKILEEINDYLTAYRPELWDITIQGVLQDLFSDFDREPLLKKLTKEANFNLSSNERENLTCLIERYKELSGKNGKMRYVPLEPIGTFENINTKSISETVTIEFELVEHSWNWFVRYYKKQLKESDGKNSKIISEKVQLLANKDEFQPDDIKTLFSACINFSERKSMVLLYFLKKGKLFDFLKLGEEGPGYNVSKSFNELGKLIGKKFSNIKYWNDEINNSKTDYFNPSSSSQLSHRFKELV